MTTTNTNIEQLKIHRVNATQFDENVIPSNELALIEVSPTPEEINKLSGLTATTSELNYISGTTSNIQTQLNGKLTSSDIYDGVDSTATDKALSANQGKVLQDQVTHLKSIGRFLSLWNCATGLAQTDPSVSPYTYKTGDYYIIGTVAAEGSTNYKPDGTTYTIGTASTVVETDTVEKGYIYWYDGNGNWTLMQTEVGTVTDVLVNNTSVVTNGVASIPYNQTINITYTDGTVSVLTLNGTLA